MAEYNETPLTAADYDGAMRIKDIVNRGIPHCDKAERCGQNVANQRQALQGLAEFADSVLREFFPNGRPQS